MSEDSKRTCREARRWLNGIRGELSDLDARAFDMNDKEYKEAYEELQRQEANVLTWMDEHDCQQPDERWQQIKLTAHEFEIYIDPPNDERNTWNVEMYDENDQLVFHQPGCASKAIAEAVARAEAFDLHYGVEERERTGCTCDPDRPSQVDEFCPEHGSGETSEQ